MTLDSQHSVVGQCYQVWLLCVGGLAGLLGKYLHPAKSTPMNSRIFITFSTGFLFFLFGNIINIACNSIEYAQHDYINECSSHVGNKDDITPKIK